MQAKAVCAHQLVGILGVLPNLRVALERQAWGEARFLLLEDHVGVHIILLLDVLRLADPGDQRVRDALEALDREGAGRGQPQRRRGGAPRRQPRQATQHGEGHGVIRRQSRTLAGFWNQVSSSPKCLRIYRERERQDTCPSFMRAREPRFKR